MSLKTLSLEKLDAISKDDLIHLYQKYFSTNPPRSNSLIKRIIAYKIQEQKRGKLKPKYQKIFEEFIHNSQIFISRKEIPKYQITEGQRITKEYKGRIFEVIKTAEGFSYDGKIYNSLSIIANKITGQKWSGPRFFNLRGRSK